MKKIIALISVLFFITSCYYESFDVMDGEKSAYMMEAEGGEDGQYESDKSGQITAGEWSDLDNWQFWANLVNSQDYCDKVFNWHFYTKNRVAVKVVDNNNKPVIGAKVELNYNGNHEWSSVSDNHGVANLWVSLCNVDSSAVDASNLTVTIDGILQNQPVNLTTLSSADIIWNNYTVSSHSYSNSADIAFVVDATGSMGDEIDFLKDDLVDILKKVEKSNSKLDIRTAAVFYRDTDDEYVTKHHDFTNKLSTLSSFIKKQEANGGGDYPEAVHTALEATLQNLSWDEDAKSKIAFLLLDAPAHYTDDIILSLQKSIKKFAQLGIKIIPISASGVDKETEFMLRNFAMATNGTYTFITNDSGIGGDHIEPSIGEYKVELLNELLIRLINYNIE